MPKNILIIKLSAIGDVLMATPSFAAIRAKFPLAKISLLIGEWSKEVVQTNPNIDQIISVDENIFWKFKIFSIFKLVLKLRKEKFDLVYVMHWSNFFNLFAFFLGAKERIGFDRFNKSILLTRKVPFTEGEKGMHTIDKYLSLVSDNVTGFDRKINVYLTQAEIEWGVKKINSLFGETSNLIGIAPGGGVNPKASMPSRRWPISKFSTLSKNLIEQHPNIRVLIFGGNTEKGLGEDILAFVKSKNIINLSGQISFRQTASLMKRCRVVITNDSSPMHLASAVETPVISIFGPTAPYDKAPQGPQDFYFYSSLPCSPCYKYGNFSNCESLKCFESITVGEVTFKVSEYL